DEHHGRGRQPDRPAEGIRKPMMVRLSDDIRAKLERLRVARGLASLSDTVDDLIRRAREPKD
ncbi:MAG: hypothetical protein AAFP22_07520, partial [Planctomycetota bacterium]